MLSGRIAFVTGGGSGIGRAVCQILAKEGAQITAFDLRRESALDTIKILEQDNKDTSHLALSGDISKSSDVTAAISSINSTFGRPASVVINCAGITCDELLLKQNEDSFQKVIDVNLKGTFLVTQAAAKSMIEHQVDEGSIINISSIVGKVGNIGQCNYAASKAGVIGFTKTAAKELARNNIRCNAVLPGFIDTPMVKTVPENIVKGLISLIPARRLGKPEEVAELCAFLASSKSSYITGTAIEVTGGLFS